MQFTTGVITYASVWQFHAVLGRGGSASVTRYRVEAERRDRGERKIHKQRTKIQDEEAMAPTERPYYRLLGLREIHCLS